MHSTKSIFLEHEFVEETIFAVAPGFRDEILLFPRTLDLTVSRGVSTNVFPHRSTVEKLDKLLQGAVYFDQGNMYNMTGIYFSRAYVRRFPFKVLTTHPFSFDKPSNLHTTGRKDEIRGDNFGHGFNVPTLSQPVIERNNGKQEEHFEKEPAPTLPVKQTFSSPSQKRQQNKESGGESRNPLMIKNEVDCSCLKIGVQDATCTRPEEKLVIFASSSLSNYWISMNEKPANEATARATVDSPETSGTLNYVIEATRNYQDTAPPLSGAVNFEFFCENGGADRSTRPLPIKKNTPKAANSCQSIQPTTQPNDLSLQPKATDSDLSDEEIDDSINRSVLLEAGSSEREEGLSDALQKSGVTADPPYNGHRKHDTIRTEQKTCLLNSDNQKRGFLNTFGRKTKLLRHHASKPERITQKQAWNVLRGQTWISRPRADDFLDMRSIQNYLEMRQQLSTAQARIHHLENQTFEDTPEPKNTEQDPQREKVLNREQQRNYSELQKEVQTTQSPSYNELPKEIDTSGIHSGRKCKSDENALRDLSLSKSATKIQHRVQANHGHEEITHKQDEMVNELAMDSHHWQDETSAINDLQYDKQNQDAQEEKQATGSEEWHNKRPCGRRGNDNRRLHTELMPWLCSGIERSVDCLERYRSKEAAKYALKMAILSMTWTEDEWMELSQLIRLKRRKEPATMAPSSSHRTDERYLVSCRQDSGTPGSHAYVNIDLGRQQDDDGGVFSRAANWTNPENRQMRRKPPIPTPRKGN